MSTAELLQDEIQYGNSSWCETCYHQTVTIVRNSVERPNSSQQRIKIINFVSVKSTEMRKLLHN